MKIILTILFTFTSALGLYGQSVEGIVIDSFGNPIPGATLGVKGTDFGTITDMEGQYSLHYTARTSEASIIVRSMGYKSVTLALDELLRRPDIVMEESALDMDAVVITGTMSPTFTAQSPVKVDVITSKYLNTFLPAPAATLIESISLINGVQEVVSCGVCFTNSISINGLPGPYTAILMDGTPIYGNLASVYGLNGIPGSIIDRIEVMKGPNSTLYGSEAVAGVINVITKDPRKQPSATFDIMTTSHREIYTDIGFSHAAGKSTGFTGLNIGHASIFKDENNDNFSDVINLDRYSLFTKWDIYRPSNKKFTIAGKFYYEDRRNGTEEFLDQRNYLRLRGNDSIYGESIFTQRAELFGTYEFSFLNNIRLDYSLSTHKQNSFYGADFYKANQEILFGNFIWDKQAGKHLLNAGITTRWQNYDDNTVATEIADDNGLIQNLPDQQFIPGLFVQDEWSFSDQISVVAGSRIDHYRRHGFIFSPRLNLKYKPGKWSTIRGNFGTGFRLVNLFTEDHAFVAGQREVVISETLDPEQSYNGALNFNHLFTLAGGQGMIDLDAYYTYFTNKIVPDYSEPDKIIYSNTNGHAISRGIGLSLNYEFAFPLSFNIGANIQNVEETDLNDIGEYTTNRIEFAPDWTAISTAQYEISRINTTLSYTWNATGPMQLPVVFDLDEHGYPQPDSRPTTSSPFHLHDIKASTSISGKLSVYAGVENILNYRQPFSPLVGFSDPNESPGFSTGFDTSYSYAPVQGREFFIGLTYTLP